MAHNEIGSQAEVQPVDVQPVFSDSLPLAEVINGWSDRRSGEEDRSWWKTVGIAQFTDKTDSPAAVPA